MNNPGECNWKYCQIGLLYSLCMVFSFYFTMCVMITISLINVLTPQHFFIVFLFINISGPIFPRKWWPFQIFHFLQNGNHSWLISKFSNTLKTTPITLTCINTSILTLPSQVLVLSWVKTGTSRDGRWLWQMLILRSLKFTCLKLSLYVLGKYGNCVNKTCGGFKKVVPQPLGGIFS